MQPSIDALEKLGREFAEENEAERITARKSTSFTVLKKKRGVLKDILAGERFLRYNKHRKNKTKEKTKRIKEVTVNDIR